MRYQYRQKRPVSGLINGIRMNFLDDLDTVLARRLKEMGIQRKDTDDAIMDYCRFMRRIISVQPRRVYKAKEFSCPADYNKKLNYLENCIEKGEDLNPFLTRSVKKLSQEDSMLYDWNIYHFHLSDQLDNKKKDGFMVRSQYLLIAYVTSEAVYFIHVVSHNEMSQHLWTNYDYIQRIKDNWSYLLEKNLIKGVPLSEKVDEATHYKLRKAHISTFTELEDGSLYGLLGGGYASDGSSTDAVFQSQYLYMVVSALEELMSIQFWNLIGQAPEVVEQLKKNDNPCVHLIGTDRNRFVLIEQELRIMFVVDFYNDTWRISMASFENSYMLFDDKKRTRFSYFLSKIREYNIKNVRN